MLPTERCVYSAIKERPRLALPDGARLVVWVIVNIEEWNPREPLPRQKKPCAVLIIPARYAQMLRACVCLRAR